MILDLNWSEYANISLLSILVVITIQIALCKDLVKCVLYSSVFSAILATEYIILNAPDVAITETSVGACVSTIYLLQSIKITGRYTKTNLNPLSTIIGTLVTISLIILILPVASFIEKLPSVGDASNNNNGIIPQFYIAHTKSLMQFPNVVTATLASFRGYDTAGETIVILTAAICVSLITKYNRSSVKTISVNKNVFHNKIVTTTIQIMIPFMILLGLYIQLNGEYSPGGGFQSGVIIASALIACSLIFGSNIVEQVVNIRFLSILGSIGTLIYVITGLIPTFFGGRYLDYNHILCNPIINKMTNIRQCETYSQQLGVFTIEIGVGLTVFSVISFIFLHLANRVEQCQ